MPTMTAGQLDDAHEIRSYTDIVAAHHMLCRKVAAGKGLSYVDAASCVEQLGRLYRKPAAITPEMRETAETALAAVHQALKTAPTTDVEHMRQFDVADTWIDRLALLVNAPTDGR